MGEIYPANMWNLLRCSRRQFPLGFEWSELIKHGVCILTNSVHLANKTSAKRLHSSRMRTARALTVWGGCLLPGGVCFQEGGCLLLGGCVCFLGGLSAPRGRCLLPGGVSAPGGCLLPHTHTHPSCGQNSWHTLLKILPCPKLRLRAVNIPKGIEDMYQREHDFNTNNILM